MSGYLRTSDGQEPTNGGPEAPMECFRCGLCCTRYQPPLPPEEVGGIAAGLGLSADDFLARYGQLTNVGYLLRQAQGQCVFLTWEKEAKASCAIYAFRPRACREWAAALSRRECRDGLTRLKVSGRILLPGELGASAEELARLAEHRREG